MNVLSLFDGMSCGQIALERSNKKYDNYFASEIKKHAIQVAKHNYPKTIHLGDVTKIDVNELPKIDLLIGGSPCQDFSSQNKKREGLKGLKSNLFFEYLRIYKELKAKNPDLKFLLENVIMLPEHFSVLCNYMESYPSEMYGDRVSAALRTRLFWTDIGPSYNDLFGFRHSCIPHPTDEKISLQSVLTDGYTDRFKALCLKVSNGGSIKEGDLKHNQKLIEKRYNKMFDNIIFNSPDLDVSKGIRFLNQTELERLHNIPEGYTSILPVKKAHDLIGDGWTVGIVSHIFSYL